MAKGCSLMSDEGADELTKVLISTGYGDDKEIANSIIDNNRTELMARIYDAITTDKDLQNTIEDIIVNQLSDEEDEYVDLEEVI